jgi:outer membrane protein OmpA-like peptidoglycan-associated protein/tetratricopeptide (TPR) repeat protein
MVVIMKNANLHIILLMVLFMVQSPVTAQNSILRFADKQYQLENYRFAASEYERAFAKKEKYETAVKIAESYEKLHEYDQSFMWWEKVIAFEKSGREDFYNYLVAGMKVGKGIEIDSLLKGTSFSKSDFPELDVEYMKNLYSKRSNFKLVPLDKINSSGSDYGLMLGEDKTVYFSSDRGEMIPSEKKAIRLDAKNQLHSEEKYKFNDRQYFSVYQMDSSGKISALAPLVPGMFHFSDPYYVKEKGVLFYTITRGFKKVKGEKFFSIYPELYFSNIGESGELLDFNAFPLNDSLRYGIISPFVDVENSKLYFSSNMEGGYGGYDLYAISFDEGFVFTDLVNLGPDINTSGNERDPFALSGKFYFSSDGHKGLGGMDVFVANQTTTGFKGIQNMGIPINSPNDDFGFRQFGKKEIYLSSDRKDGQGMDDIYGVEELYKQFIAKVIDCEGVIITESYLATLRDKTQNGILQTQRGQAGELMAELEPESDYELKISKPGYFSLTDENISVKGFEGDTLKREYTLTPIPYQLPVYVDIVYYDLDKFVIREDAKPALDKLAEMMKKYSFLDLLVTSHTDSRASDEYNIILSNDRAKAVTEYLGTQHIPADRIRLEWYGEQNLTNDCGNGMPCPDREHQLNRRSELVLEAFPDPSKQYEIPAELRDMDFCEPIEIFEMLQNEINELPTIYFDFDKSMLRSVHKTELERTAIMLKRMPNLMLYIEGHTDQRGADAYNQKLSERRSQVVKEYLTKRGVESNRMDYKWFGETKPVHDCNEVTCTPAMHQLNRRTELWVGRSSFSYTGRRKKIDTM